MATEADAPPTTPGPMSPEERANFAVHLRDKLNSRRDNFVIDKFMFEPQEGPGDYGTTAFRARRLEHPPVADADGQEKAEREIVKTVSAATLRLLLDYCESAWDMDLRSYCAGIFHGREPNEGETAFDLLPDVRQRVSADRLGFGHIYGGGD